MLEHVVDESSVELNVAHSVDLRRSILTNQLRADVMNRMITWPYGPILLLTAAVCAGQLEAFPEPDLIQRLQAGGYVLFIRHFQTNPDEADTDPLNLENVKGQRKLSDEGANRPLRWGMCSVPSRFEWIVS